MRREVSHHHNFIDIQRRVDACSTYIIGPIDDTNIPAPSKHLHERTEVNVQVPVAPPLRERNKGGDKKAETRSVTVIDCKRDRATVQRSLASK